MAGSAARRARRLAAENGEDYEEVDDSDLEAGEAPPSRFSRFSGTGRTGRLAALFGPQSDDGSGVPSSLLMQAREFNVAYAVAVVLVIIPVAFLAAGPGAGAPHPSKLLPAVGAALALAAAASVRLANRVDTSILAVLSSLATTTAVVPNTVRFLSTLDLFAALGFALWISLRQSKVRNQRMAERRAAARQAKARSAGRAGTPTARGRKGQKAVEPVGRPANRRYTPPKNRPAK